MIIMKIIANSFKVSEFLKLVDKYKLFYGTEDKYTSALSSSTIVLSQADQKEFDEDVAEFLKRNAQKIRYHSGEKVQNWLYKNANGRETSLAKKVYVDFKRYNSVNRIMGKVTFHNEDNRDLRRENLTVRR